MLTEKSHALIRLSAFVFESESMKNYDVIVIGAGVIGCSVAHHLAKLGAKSVLVLEQSQIGAGTTSQSSGILRTHYSVPENVALAKDSWKVFTDFANYLGDDEAAAGLVKCGYLIAAPDGPKLEPLAAALKAQQAQGIEVQLLDRQQGEALLPIASLADAVNATIQIIQLGGFEPEAGFADAYLVATSFARAARRGGVKIMEGVTVTKLMRDGNRVVGVETSQGNFSCGNLVSTQNIWAAQLQDWVGLPMPVVPERHTVLALEGPQPYSFAMPVFKDLGSPGMLYCRSYGGTQMREGAGRGAPRAAPRRALPAGDARGQQDDGGVVPRHRLQGHRRPPRHDPAAGGRALPEFWRSWHGLVLDWCV